MSASAPEKQRVRLDKWLWAARFFKTRSQASAAVKGGHVHLNGRRVKASASVRAGDAVHVTKGSVAFEIEVTALSEKRGPAVQAQQLYTETPASIAAREQAAAERRVARSSMPRPAARPDKKQRRQLRRFKEGE